MQTTILFSYVVLLALYENVRLLSPRIVGRFQSQLILVGFDGMQVDAVECRFIRSYLWFEGALVAVNSGRKSR
jgi:hypothetical protein